MLTDTRSITRLRWPVLCRTIWWLFTAGQLAVLHVTKVRTHFHEVQGNSVADSWKLSEHLHWTMPVIISQPTIQRAPLTFFPANLVLVLKHWIKPNKSKHKSVMTYTTTQNTPKKLQPGLATSYNLRPGNEMGLTVVFVYHVRWAGMLASGSRLTMHSCIGML